MRTLLFSILFLATASTASACLNDVTLIGSEREFRSQYQTTTPAVPSPPDASRHYTVPVLGLAGGAALIVAALALTFRRSTAA
jgi:hypothetical protein